MKRFIIDANNMSNIAYHQAKGILIKEGQDSQSLEKTIPPFTTKIFFNIAHKYFKDYPDHQFFFVWDGRHGSKWRRKQNTDYKSNRDHSNDKQYDSFIKSMVWQKEILDLYPVIQLTFDESEADDIIYTLCEISENQTIISSTDEDMLQLAQRFSYVKVWNPRKKILIDPPEYDIILYKAIVGDSSDNIKGLYKFGPKKALKTINENLENLTAEQRNLVEENQTIIDLSKNPACDYNKTRVIDFLEKNKIHEVNLDLIKKAFFDKKQPDFLKKWDSLSKIISSIKY